MKKTKKRELIEASYTVGAMLIVLTLFTFAVKCLWNWIMPRIILCNEINAWQALGLVVVVSLLTFDKSKLFKWFIE